MEAGVLAITQRVAERAGRLAHTHRDGAGVLDLLQGVFGVGGTHRQNGGQGEQGSGHEKLLRRLETGKRKHGTKTNNEILGMADYAQPRTAGEPRVNRRAGSFVESNGSGNGQQLSTARRCAAVLWCRWFASRPAQPGSSPSAGSGRAPRPSRTCRRAVLSCAARGRRARGRSE